MWVYDNETQEWFWQLDEETVRALIQDANEAEASALSRNV